MRMRMRVVMCGNKLLEMTPNRERERGGERRSKCLVSTQVRTEKLHLVCTAAEVIFGTLVVV